MIKGGRAAGHRVFKLKNPEEDQHLLHKDLRSAAPEDGNKIAVVSEAEPNYFEEVLVEEGMVAELNEDEAFNFAFAKDHCRPTSTTSSATAAAAESSATAAAVELRFCYAPEGREWLGCRAIETTGVHELRVCSDADVSQMQSESSTKVSCQCVYGAAMPQGTMVRFASGDDASEVWLDMKNGNKAPEETEGSGSDAPGTDAAEETEGEEEKNSNGAKEMATVMQEIEDAEASGDDESNTLLEYGYVLKPYSYCDAVLVGIPGSLAMGDREHCAEECDGDHLCVAFEFEFADLGQVGNCSNFRRRERSADEPKYSPGTGSVPLCYAKRKILAGEKGIVLHAEGDYFRVELEDKAQVLGALNYLRVEHRNNTALPYPILPIADEMGVNDFLPGDKVECKATLDFFYVVLPLEATSDTQGTSFRWFATKAGYNDEEIVLLPAAAYENGDLSSQRETKDASSLTLVEPCTRGLYVEVAFQVNIMTAKKEAGEMEAPTEAADADSEAAGTLQAPQATTQPSTPASIQSPTPYPAQLLTPYPAQSAAPSPTPPPSASSTP